MNNRSDEPPPNKLAKISSISSMSESIFLDINFPQNDSGISAVKHDDQPDPDAIKMFIGQIPKTWGEVEVRKLLEVYGPIYQLNILRDKGSVISKGLSQL